MKPKNYAYRHGALMGLIQSLQYDSRIFKLLKYDNAAMLEFQELIENELVETDKKALEYENL